MANLPEHDQQKASRFKNHTHGYWWAYVRLSVRRILAKYYNCQANEIEFAYSDSGKPFVTNARKANLYFNLSHTQGLALLAITEFAELGIDVERLKVISDMQNVIKHFFASAEQAHINSLPTEYVENSFYEIWTQKESVIKASGDGLKLALDSFIVLGVTEQSWAFIHPLKNNMQKRFSESTFATQNIALNAQDHHDLYKAAITLDITPTLDSKPLLESAHLPSVKIVEYLASSVDGS